MTTPKPVQPAKRVSPENEMETEHNSSIDVAIQGSLGRKLRESYEEVVREAIPNKLLRLLDDLKEAESAAKPKNES